MTTRRRTSAIAMCATLATLATFAVVVMLTNASCTRARSDFGRPCVDDVGCDDGSLCLEGACVALRVSGARGESCGDPLSLTAPSTPAPLALGEVTTSFGGAKLDEELQAACAQPGAEAHDIVVRFELDEESAIRVRATADFPVALAVRRLDDPDAGDDDDDNDDDDRDGDETCDARPGDRCAGADVAAVTADGRTRELLVPRVAAGAHVVIVTAPLAAVGAVRVDVELIDCPVGFMPIGDAAPDSGACIGWREIERLPVPAVAPRVAAIRNGLLLVGGRPLAAPDTAAAFFDTTTESWSFVELEEPVASAGILALDDGTLIILGDDDDVDQIVFQSMDGAKLRVLDDDELSSPFLTAPASIDIIASARGGVALVPDHVPTFLRLTPRDAPCPTGFCPSPFQCIETLRENGSREQLCTCLIEPCGAPPLGYVLGLDADATVGAPLAARFAFAPLPSGRTLISGFSDGQARLFDALNDAFSVRPNLVHRPGAALTAVDGSTAALSGGLATPDDGGAAAPSPTVDLYDVDNGSLRTFIVPGAARSDHTATFAFGHIVLVGGRDVAGALARTTLVDGVTGASVELEELAEPRVDHVAVVLDDARLLVTGGSRGDGVPAPRDFILERVRRGRPPPPVDDEPAPLVPPEDCDFITDLDLSSGSVVVDGTTAGRRDEVRTDMCSASRVRDTIYRFTLDEPAHVAIEVTSAVDRPLWIARGPCRDEDREDVLCSFNSLELLTLDAGAWLVVVEASFREAQGEISGPDASAFTLSVRNVGAATDICSGDDFDPRDDSVDEPRRMTRDDVNGSASTFSAAGVLCPGDVDHILLEHAGGFFSNGLFGLDPTTAEVIPADADVAASAAAGAPVVIPRLGEVRPLLEAADRDLDAGLYVIALRAPALDGVALRPAWSFAASPFCVADANDSLVPPLDDAVLPAARTTLRVGNDVHIALCYPGDVDVLPLDFSDAAATSGDLLVSVGFLDGVATLHPLLAGGALGPALPADVDASSGDIELRVEESEVPAAVALRVVGDDDAFDDLILVGFRRVGGPGDTCAQPLALSPDDGARTFSTVAFNDDADADVLGGCTGFRTPGLDSFHSVSLGTGDTLVVDAVGTDGDSPDVALYIVDTCPPVLPDACLVGVDQGFTLEPEHLEFTNTGPASTFFLVVDSFFGTTFEVDLAWSIDRP